jgi:hypothetical protein
VEKISGFIRVRKIPVLEMPKKPVIYCCFAPLPHSRAVGGVPEPEGENQPAAGANN